MQPGNKGRQWGGFRRVSGGAAIGKIAKKVYVCRSCLNHFIIQPAQCECGSMTFDHFHSTAEANRWGLLLMMQSQGMIRDLDRQEAYTLHAYNHEMRAAAKVGKYVSDFTYIDVKTGAKVVEDTKGAITDIFDWKRKHVLAEYGITIKLTK